MKVTSVNDVDFIVGLARYYCAGQKREDRSRPKLRTVRINLSLGLLHSRSPHQSLHLFKHFVVHTLLILVCQSNNNIWTFEARKPVLRATVASRFCLRTFVPALLSWRFCLRAFVPALLSPRFCPAH